MPNLKAKIEGGIKKILEHTPPPKNLKTFQLFEKRKLSIRGACLTENVLYYAKISCDDEKLFTEYWKLRNKKLHPRIS